MITSRHVEIGAAVAGHESGRGHKIAKIEAQFHGSIQVEERQGVKITMAAVEKIREQKQKPMNVIMHITTKGVYIDERKSKNLFKKVPITNLSYVSIDPRNKKIFSFIEFEARMNRKTCYTFAVKKHAENFKKGCHEAIQQLIDAGHRAEAEVAQIMAATPIMPVQASVPEEYYDDDEVEGEFEFEDEEDEEVITDDGSYYSHVNDNEGIYEAISDGDTPWCNSADFEHFLSMYKAQYLGCCPVQEIEGHQIATAAGERVRAMNFRPRDVTIVVTKTGIILVERRTGDYLQENSITIISYSLLDPRDKLHFYYIVNDPRIGFAYCHVLKLVHPGAPIQKAIGQAHRAAEAQRRIMAQKLGSSGEAATQQNQSSLGMYECKYLGSLNVASSKGNATITAAVDTRHKELGTHESGDWTMHGLDVVLVVSTESLRTVELTTADMLCDVFIREVAFSTCVDSGAADQQHDIFAFVSQDRMSRLKCHLYKCPPGMARQICKTVGWAFKLAMDEVQNEASNPFTPTGEPIKPNRMNVEDMFPEHLRIKRRNLTPVEAIGAGQFGKVFLADFVNHDRSTGATSHRKVAVKMLRSGAKEADEDDFLREALVMVELDHPHLVQMVGVSLRATPWLVVLEFLKYGDLKTVMTAAREKGIKLTNTEQMNFAVQLAAGMRFLASKRLVHMDLAARNCLLHENSIVKVGDFGLAKKFDDGEEVYKLKPGVSMKLPIKWMAIESFDKLIFSEKSDVWSFGVVLWEICNYGAQPYPKIRNKEIRRMVKKGLRLARPDYPHSNEMFAMMKRCWITAPEKRPNFKQLYHALRRFLEKELKAAQDTNGGEHASDLLRDIGNLAQNTKVETHKDAEVLSGAQTTWVPTKSNADEDDGYTDIDDAFKRGGAGVDSNVERMNPLFAAGLAEGIDLGHYDDVGELDLYFDIQDGMALPKDFVQVYAVGDEQENQFFDIVDGKARPKHGTVVFYEGQKVTNDIYFEVTANGEVMTGDHIVMYTAYNEFSGEGADSGDYFDVGANGMLKPLGDEFGLDPSKMYSVVNKAQGCVELYDDITEAVIELYDDVQDFNDGNYFDVDQIEDRGDGDYFDVGFVEAKWNDEGDYFEVSHAEDQIDQIYTSVDDLRKAAAQKGKRLRVEMPKAEKVKRNA